MRDYSLPQGGIFNSKNIIIKLPSKWSLNVCDFPSCGMKPAGKKVLIDRLRNPVGAKRLREIAKGKKEVVIIFDDISRGTRIFEMVFPVLDELKSAGIKNDNIRFICAVGSHGAHDRIDFKKKLGEKILSNFPVYNHNPFENCKYLGNTSRGTRVMLNAEVLKCDLKIGIGSIVPHCFYGFSGGSKIILPGVAAIDTIYGNHILKSDELAGRSGNFVDDLGKSENNVMANEAEEVCRMCGLDFIVNSFVNHKCENVDFIAGDPIDTHNEGIKIGKKLYGTKFSGNADLVIVNTNFKMNEATIALSFGKKTLKKGGDIVVINHSQIGQVVHYLAGGFGKYYGGKLWTIQKGNLLENVGKVVMFNPYYNKVDEDWFGGFGKMHWAKRWEDVINILNYGTNENIKVNLFPDATIQYFLDS